MNNKNLPITILALTASILFVGLIIVETVSPPTVYAGSMQDRGGDYSVTSTRVSTSEEVLWVVDARTKMAAVYQYDSNAGKLNLRNRINVAELAVR